MSATKMPSDAWNAFMESPGPEVASSGAGPLAGCSLAVKDIYDVAGYVTGRGNPDWKNETGPAERTAPSVQILLDAGASFTGKTQTDELAFSLTGDNAHYPRPINPAAPDRVTGGSSSGSAAAVAGGLADIATGSDTGGSIRGPASFCGLIGLRATHGVISLEGTMALSPSLDVFGWFARDMELYERVAGLLLPDSDARFTRVKRLPEMEALLLAPDAREAYETMLAKTQGVLGAAGETAIESLDADQRYWCFRNIQAHEAWREHSVWISAKDRHLGPGVRERFDYGATIDRQTYDEETRRRRDLTREVEQLLGDDGLILMPTMPGAAPLADASFEAIQDYRERALRMLCLSGLTGMPQLTLPMATVSDAPFGLSLFGPAGSDRALLRLGRRILEAANGS
ncbi:amidase [Hoeflea sp. WL0058]|uniref:Amidase n=1 Tax=Flavimaribacter sediminis TaxID=2865987 RepID=A0AAE2ZLU5_9HYPH|nr:amidase [Flavimaribacter sediminis]MBW8639244.1 amidase [Flavimaribacter sediminis]